ncbi:methylenetetrahydrofolate reductase [NAD(P)H] [Flammeovirga yaeyamensis]|uniref:Methylenetetrahydrofolate reductase n=2 Tax=Flammeovirga yaeyamensis TaxID=367791 RepID=A0AAX1N1D1_9BACT|nr:MULTISPECIES: methylenetetrahydrofolate reductase [NAD(P)H] [Flammeovirga]ANQ51297.1 methylenetetrahydrofolate reductase [NAD(P)H] [Flammeovirga sp. MY04]MBB3698351.1 methylenetetrahydrofolate reductase (NADPH) [Flammeovirga yaeyamensis]NMF34296.1 methylenetetrahydrofolate reductase [NAD(P)H] [Flammeovirga yaeyamensis]QWG01279.1 methylenetetrahydrofolate reductase [NAD(P)H] [Flammeovirga yaeyamensis]
MKVIDRLIQAEREKKTLFSFELLPPVRGKSIQSLFDAIDPLMEFNPAFVDVTYHREEYVYKELPNGLFEKSVQRHRPGTVAVCAAIMHKYNVDTVPHIICGGFSKEETENILIELNFLGIENILALRGDAAKGEAAFTPHPKGYKYASELVEHVDQLNKGEFMYAESGFKGGFCMGVAGYPEKHMDASNLDTDIKYLKQKVDLGAEYIVTQMFFDNQKYFDFVKRCREAGITVPIIPGLKPLTTKRQLTLLPNIFKLDFPQELIKEAEKCKDNKAIKQLGIEFGIQQAKELMEFGVPSMHYYSMGRSTSVKDIAEAIF